jgi:prophage regulatory protein
MKFPEATDKKPTRILRLLEVEARTGNKEGLIYREMRDGRFPRPIKIGPRAVGWLEHEIDELIERRIAERDARIAARKAARAVA